jgi:hypothetical protein
MKALFVWARPQLSAAVGAWLACQLLACSDTTPPPLPASFERPNRVAFLCVDTLDPDRATDPEKQLHSLSSCKWATPTTPAVGSLHALILQSSRGELGAVDLQALKVIDARADIPGYTFVPTGEIPVALAIAAYHPQVTYVANSGSRDISVIRTVAVLGSNPGEEFLKQPRVRIEMPGSDDAAVPYDMVLSPDEDALFVSAPEAGLLLRYPIIRCADGTNTCAHAGELDVANVRSIPLADSLAKLPSDVMTETKDEPYRLVCDGTTLGSASAPQSISLADDVQQQTPQPAGLAIDAFCAAGECTRRLLVADRALPLIHAIDLDALAAGEDADAILTPIVTGVPTTRVVATPHVPVSLRQDDGETQYVYAIDAGDGSVLVTQDGRVQNVNVDPSLRPDRIDLGNSFSTGLPTALSLAMLTPDYDVFAPANQWIAPNSAAASGEETCTDALTVSHETRNSARLRGVYLAVGVSDGTVRIVNIHDMELLQCRDGACDINNTGYDPYPVIRNRPRIGLTYIAPTSGAVAPALGPSMVPQFVIEGVLVGVQTDGTTNDPRVSGLDCLPCANGEVNVFPIEDEVVATDGGVELAPSTQTGATITSQAGSGDVDQSGNPTTETTPVTATISSTCARGEGRVCALGDPWIDPANWSATFEGNIPGTRGGRGRFVAADDSNNQSGSLEFTGEVPFCALGVLGDDELGTGDQVEIVSALPGQQTLDGYSAPIRDACVALVNARDVDFVPIAFRIKAAYADHVVVDPALIAPPREALPVGADYALVQQCFDAPLLAYQIHTRESFVVVSNSSIGFQHRVVTDSGSQHCVVDKSQDPKHDGRAHPGAVFDNGVIAFKTKPGNPEAGTVLTLYSYSNTTKLILDVASLSTGELRGVLPVDVEYGPVDHQLYVVDITQRGLIQVPLDPMPTAVDASYQ